jgi:hypothetical protein
MRQIDSWIISFGLLADGIIGVVTFAFIRTSFAARLAGWTMRRRVR